VFYRVFVSGQITTNATTTSNIQPQRQLQRASLAPTHLSSSLSSSSVAAADAGHPAPLFLRHVVTRRFKYRWLVLALSGFTCMSIIVILSLVYSNWYDSRVTSYSHCRQPDLFLMTWYYCYNRSLRSCYSDSEDHHILPMFIPPPRWRLYDQVGLFVILRPVYSQHSVVFLRFRTFSGFLGVPTGCLRQWRRYTRACQVKCPS